MSRNVAAFSCCLKLFLNFSDFEPQYKLYYYKKSVIYFIFIYDNQYILDIFYICISTGSIPTRWSRWFGLSLSIRPCS